MCYNVLCDKYATRQLYGYCPSWALNWEYRKKGIMEDITNCDADIISLQVRPHPPLSKYHNSALNGVLVDTGNRGHRGRPPTAFPPVRNGDDLGLVCPLLFSGRLFWQLLGCCGASAGLGGQSRLALQ